MDKAKSHFLRASLLFAFCFIFVLSFTTKTLALNINGSGSSGGGNTTTVSGGYAIKSTDSGNAPAYRFSIINNSGTDVVQSYDIYRSAYSEYMGTSYHKFSIKYPKTVLKTIYTTSFSTSATNSYCKTDSSIGLTLPASTTGVAGWCSETNIATLLSKLYGWSNPISYLSQNGYAVLIEPIYPVKLQNQYHSLTVSEIAVYGAAMFGASTVPASSNTAGSWSIISDYTNRYYPSALYTTQQYANLPAGGVLSSRASFASVINNGYGALIVYGDNLTTYTNTITHWKYVGTGGDNPDGTSKNMGTSTFKGTYGQSVTIPNNLVQSYTGYYNTGIGGSFWGTGTWDSKDIGSTFTQPNCSINIEYYYKPITYTNSIAHWASGFKGDGNNGDGNAFKLNTTYFSSTYGSVYSLDSTKAVTPPKGFYLDNKFGTSNINDSWLTYQMGTSVTQNSKNMFFEYDYRPLNYKITYDLNGGIASVSSPSTYNVLESAGLGTPTREGYTFKGWYGDLINPSSNMDSRSYLNWDETITFTNNTTGNSLTSTKVQIWDSSWNFLDCPISTTKTGKVEGKYTHNYNSGYYIIQFAANGTKKDYSKTSNFYFEKGRTYDISWTQEKVSSSEMKASSLKIIGSTTGKIEFVNDVDGNIYYDTRILIMDSSWSSVIGEPIIANKTGEVNGKYTHTADSGYYIVYFKVRTNIKDPGMSYLVYLAKGNTYDISWIQEEFTSSKSTISNFKFQGLKAMINGDATTKFGSADELYSHTNKLTKGDLSFTALWEPVTYSVKYDANGGSEAPSNQIKTYGEDLTLSNDVPSRTGYEFIEWNTKADGSGTSYAAGGSYTANADVTLYAIWNPTSHPVIKSLNGKDFITIFVGTKFIPLKYVTAFDEIDGDLTSAILVTENNVPVNEEGYTDTVGSGYKVKYKVVNSANIEGTFELTVNIVDEIPNTADSKGGYIRFIKKNCIDTLEDNSKWGQGTLKTSLESVLAKDLKDTSSCKQVWYFPANPTKEEKEKGYKSSKEVREWCLTKPKGTETNQAFLSRFSGNRTQ